ncbi:hypothetical protein JCM9279_006118 [Rhodotorula babjevae]
MSQQGGGSRGKRAWTVQWRNFQARKNKTWESDGYMLVSGLGVTVHSDDGVLLGAKNLLKPPVEDDEFSISNKKEVRVESEISLKEYYRNIHGGSAGDDDSSTSTPAKAVPGYLTRPGMIASTSASKQQTPRPASSTRPATATPVPGSASLAVDTPETAGKLWNQPAVKSFTPFKPPAPASAAKRPLLGGSSSSQPVPSRLRDSTAPAHADERGSPVTSDSARASRERKLEELKASRTGSATGKGKGRAVFDASSDTDDELENSPPEHVERPSAQKKRRIDSPRSATAAVGSASAARSTSRLSAADQALERALGKTAAPTRTTSLPDRLPSSSAKSQPLFRHDSSQSAASHSHRAPVDDGDEQEEQEDADDGLVSEDDMDVEMDSSVLGDDVLARRDVEMGGSRAAGASTDSATMSQGAGAVKRYNCQWRKRTQKKNPTWEGDGVVLLRGDKAELTDIDTGKRLGSTTWSKREFKEGDFLRIGDMDVEIGDLVVSRSSTTSTAGTSQRSAQLKAIQPTSLTLKPFRTPAPAKATNPLAQRIASGSPERARSARAQTPLETLRAALPAGTAHFKLPGLASMSVVSSSSAYGIKEVRKGARFDPQAEGALVMRRPDDEHQQIYNKKGLPVVDVVVDPLIGDKLREHQREGVKFLYECVMGMRTTGQGCLLADDMGLGKTIQSIALMWTLLKQNPYQGGPVGVVERVMIVCPVTLIKNWSAEIRKWLGRDKLRVYVADAKHPVSTFARNKSYDVLIVGYDKVRAYIDDVKYAQPPIGLIICDEGHRLKSATAKTTMALQSLSCMRRIILSGTPVQNNLGELFAMLDFVNPGILNDAAYFKRNYETPIVAARAPNATAKQKEAGKDARESLLATQGHFVLRRTNEGILKHLPPKFEFTVFIRPTQLQLSLYREVLSSSRIRSLLKGENGQQGLALLQSILKLSTSPGLLLKHIKEKGLGHLDESLLDVLPMDADPADFHLSGKFSVLGTMLAELRRRSEEKIVIVSNYTTTLDLIETHCKRKKYPYCRLDGKTPQMDRMPMVESFNRGTQKNQFIFLLSSKGGGTGLNITGASRLVQVDSDWNPSNDLQAMARIHREGQKRNCYIYRFLTAGTIDEVVFQRQIIKLALSGSVMDQDGKGAAKAKDAFTLDELRNLFSLHEGVACQTHELTGCRCHFGEVPNADADGADDDDSSDDDDEMEGFVQASQFQDDDAIRKIPKQRRNLSILKTWTHYDCADERALDELEDGLLQSVIYERMVKADQVEAPIPHEGNGSLFVRGGQVGFVFGKQTSAPAEEEEVDVDGVE